MPSAVTHTISIQRYYLNKDLKRRSLDTNFVNTMTILGSSPSSNEFLGDQHGWIAFERSGRSVFRKVRFSRQISDDFLGLCVDYDFMRILRLKDKQIASFRPVAWYDYLRWWSWYNSMTPTLRIAFWFTVGGALLGAFFGTLLGEGFARLIHR